MKKLFIGLTFSLLWIEPVLAQFTQVMQFPLSEDTQVIAVPLYPGTGVTISFVRTDRRVETMFLDNREYVALDTDGCINGIQSNCPQNEASIVNVRLLERARQFRNPYSELAKLTIVTIDGDRRRHLQVFELSGTNRRNDRRMGIIEFVPRDRLVPAADSTERIFRQGIQRALARGRLNDPKLTSKLLGIADLLGRGDTFDAAVHTVGVNRQVAQTILQIGREP
jgi:hypothetical protein